jgi:hypothetical protein
MHRPDGSLLQLDEILRRIPGEGLLWTFLTFDGIGVPPEGTTIPEFRDATEEASTGVHFSWADLLHFAAGLEQTIECVLLAVEAEGDLVPDELENNDFSRAKIMIEAVDSTLWEVWVNDDTVAATAVLQG